MSSASLYGAGVNCQFFVEYSLGEVEDEHGAIAGSHGNQWGIVEPVLGGEGRAHSEDRRIRGDATPQTSENQLEGHQTIHRYRA